MPPEPSFTLGIEEEFQVIDPATRELKSHIHELFAEGEKRLKDEIKREMHDAVIEVGTPICQNIKASNIKIYTIRVIDGNADLLKQCATSPSNYFDVQQASQLTTVFNQIAQNLANLRIAK